MTRLFINAREVDMDIETGLPIVFNVWRPVPVTDFPPPTLPTPICRECHAENLEDSYQSTRDGTVLCPACFTQRKEKRLAGQYSGEDTATKTTHPLDQW
jgi:hypothetical protein